MDKNYDSLAMNWLRLIPFLLSEKIRVMDTTTNGHICLTNFRLIFYSKRQSHTISLPIYLIRRADASLGHLNITTKIGTIFVCSFNNVFTAEAWGEKINSMIDYPVDLTQMFAFSFRKAVKEFDINHPFLQPVMNCLELSNNDTVLEAALVLHEFSRMEFSHHWKVTDVNSNFRICSSYPKYHIMPRNISDADIPLMAEFRSHNRFPSVVWRSKKTGAILLRCAQPCVGLMYYRNELDEQFVRAVLANCRADPKSKHRPEDSSGLLIVDARNWRTAQLNRFRGGGFEYVEYYDQSQIRFMNLPNLHYVRDSFERLVKLYDKPDTNWYSALETTKWLDYIGQLLKSASEVATALDAQGRPVMVHCTDGWDRTPQLTSLSQILLDPYYRTIQGFRILVEREWLQFGHKFADRCGHSEETSPIFLQWLDCVRQVQRQFPAYFEFNELFLIKLAMHTYSGLFGTFLCNSECERQAMHLSSETCSVWSFLNAKRNWSLCNYLYEPKSEVIIPAYHVKSLDLWDSLYQNALLPCTIVNTPTTSRSEDEPCEVQQQTKQLGTSAFIEARPSPQPLEVALPTSVITSSGPPTHISSCNNATERNQQLNDDRFVPDDLHRSLSLSTLSKNNYTVDDQLIVLKSSVEAQFAVPTSSTADEAPHSKPTVRSSSCSPPRKRIEDEAHDEVDSERLPQMSRSHADVLLENSNQSQQQQLPSSLQTSDTPTVVVKLFSAPSSPAEANFGDPTNLRPFNSSQEIRESRKPSHTRCFSDPESTHRLRISSLCDVLLVDTQVGGTDNAEDVCGEKSMNDDVDNDGEKTILTTDVDNAQTHHWSIQKEGGGQGDGETSPNVEAVFSTNRSFPNESFTIPDENMSLDNDLDAFCQDQNPESKSIFTMSHSSSAGAFVPWGNNYFTDPIFSNSFTSLNKEDAMRRDSGSSKGEMEEESAGKGLEINMSRTHSTVAVPSNRLQQKLITRSRTMAGAPDVDNAEALLQLRHSTSLRFSSPPENLNQFLVDGSSRDAKPICPRWPSDFDGLPMRIEPVTWRLHHRAEEERRSRTDLQIQIEILQRQQQDSQAMIQSLLEEVTRLRLLSEASRNSTDASNRFRNGNHSSSSNSPPTNNNFTNFQNADRFNGTRRHVEPATIEEALSEAMDQSFDRNASGDYIENELMGSIIDGELKDQDGYDHLSPVYVPLLHCSKIPRQDFGRSLSFCSDVSSFEVVDVKEASDVNGNKICSSCSLAVNSQEPIKPCRNCSRTFCNSCSAWTYEGQIASQVPHLCKACWNKLSSGSPPSTQIARSGVEPLISPSCVPQADHSLDALIFDDDLSSSPIGIHTQYVTTPTIASQNCSTSDESPVCESKRVNNSSCRRSRYVANNPPVSNGHSQNGVARA